MHRRGERERGRRALSEGLSGARRGASNGSGGAIYYSGGGAPWGRVLRRRHDGGNAAWRPVVRRRRYCGRAASWVDAPVATIRRPRRVITTAAAPLRVSILVSPSYCGRAASSLLRPRRCPPFSVSARCSRLLRSPQARVQRSPQARLRPAAATRLPSGGSNVPTGGRERGRGGRSTPPTLGPPGREFSSAAS